MYVKHTLLLKENHTNFESFSPLKIFILKIVSSALKHLEHIYFPWSLSSPVKTIVLILFKRIFDLTTFLVNQDLLFIHTSASSYNVRSPCNVYQSDFSISEQSPLCIIHFNYLLLYHNYMSTYQFPIKYWSRNQGEIKLHMYLLR